MWRNGQSLVEEYEAEHGRLPADEAFAIAMMHTLACRRGQDAMHRGVRDLVDERTSTERGRPVVALRGVPGPLGPPPRQVIREGFAGGPPALVDLAAKDPHTKEVAAKQMKLDAMFQLLMEDFVDPEEIGLSTEDLRDPLKFQQFKDSLLVAPSRLGVQRLGTLVSSLRRWKRWALEFPCSVNKPTPFQSKWPCFCDRLVGVAPQPLLLCGMHFNGIPVGWAFSLLWTIFWFIHFGRTNFPILVSRPVSWLHGNW